MTTALLEVTWWSRRRGRWSGPRHSRSTGLPYSAAHVRAPALPGAAPAGSPTSATDVGTGAGSARWAAGRRPAGRRSSGCSVHSITAGGRPGGRSAGSSPAPRCPATEPSRAATTNSATSASASALATAGASACPPVRRLPAAAPASSCSGSSRNSAHGEKQASRRRLPPASVASRLGNSVCPSAAPPSARTATMANFDRISATSSSTARTAQIRRAGQTIAAKNSGSISTITYTAAWRVNSSTHNVIAAITVSTPTNSTRLRCRPAPSPRRDRRPCSGRPPVPAPMLTR